MPAASISSIRFITNSENSSSAIVWFEDILFLIWCEAKLFDNVSQRNKGASQQMLLCFE